MQAILLCFIFTEIIKMNKFWVTVLLMFVAASLLVDDRYCRICVRRSPKILLKWLFYDIELMKRS